MTGMYGADVSQLRALAARLELVANQLHSTRLSVGSAVQASPWHGPAADSFRASWAGQHSASLDNACRLLLDGARRARANADGQERTSAVDGGSNTSGAVAAASSGSSPDPVGVVLNWAGHVGDVAGIVTGAGEQLLKRFSPRWPAGTDGGLGGQFRDISDMGVFAKFKAALTEDNWVARAGQADNLANWATASKWVGRAGVVVSFAASAWGEWREDSSNASLSTTAKVTRAGVKGAATAAGGWVGAAIGVKVGAAIGVAVGGPVGAAVGAAVGGLAGGIIGSGVGDMAGDFVKDKAGQAADAVGSWLSSVNPFK